MSNLVVFQSRFLGYAVWLGSDKKIKFRRGLYQTEEQKEIDFLSKDKNVVRLTKMENAAVIPPSVVHSNVRVEEPQHQEHSQPSGIDKMKELLAKKAK